MGMLPIDSNIASVPAGVAKDQLKHPIAHATIT
jgi:hypothetical protein